MNGERTTMKAGVLHAPHDLRYETVPAPKRGAEDVLVSVRQNGICGSDLHFFEDGRLGPFRVTEPYIPGHEASGVVVEAPEGCPIGVGTRVAVEPGIPCRRCAHCKSGRYNLCPSVVFLSAPPVNGTFAELAAVPWDFAHELPSTIDDEEGAFVEPVSVAVQACTRGQIEPGSTIVILGAGPIGLVTLLVARAFGASEVHVVDILKNRLRLAERIGAASAVDSRSVEPAEAVAAVTDGQGADAVIDTTGSSAACAIAPDLCRRGGVVVLVGWPETPNVHYPIEQVLEKELDVRGVNRYCNTYPRAIAMMSSGAVDVKPLISHRFTLSSIPEAFAYVAGNREEVIKAMVATAPSA